MGTSSPVYIIMTLATGTPPSLEYGYLSLTIFLSIFLMIMAGVVFIWFQDWLMIGVDALLNIFKKVK